MVLQARLPRHVFTACRRSRRYHVFDHEHEQWYDIRSLNRLHGIPKANLVLCID